MSAGKILVVDDEPQLRRVMKVTLTSEGYEVTDASTGEQATERIRQDRFDLILLDMNMPRVDGYHVLRTIRYEKHLKDVPVVVFTGAGERACEDALRLGADDFLIKGATSVPQIMQCVGRFLGKSA